MTRIFPLVAMTLAAYIGPLGALAQPQNDLGPPWALVEVLFGDEQHKLNDDGTCDEFLLDGLTVTLRNEDGQDLASSAISPQGELDYPEQVTPAYARFMSEGACASGMVFRDIPKAGGYRFVFGEFSMDETNAEDAFAWVWINFYSRSDDYRTWYDDQGKEHCDILADNPIKTGALGEIWPMPVDYETLGEEVGEVTLDGKDTGSQCKFEARFGVLDAAWQQGVTNPDIPISQQVMFGG